MNDCNNCIPQPLKTKEQTVQSNAKGLLFDNGDFITDVNASGQDTSAIQGANNTLGANLKTPLVIQ